MADTSITPRWAPRRHIVRDGVSSPHTIRAYRSHPEGVELQVRLKGEYVTCSLTFDEAREISDAILAAVQS